MRKRSREQDGGRRGGKEARTEGEREEGRRRERDRQGQQEGGREGEEWRSAEDFVSRHFLDLKSSKHLNI